MDGLNEIVRRERTLFVSENGQRPVYPHPESPSRAPPDA